MRAAEKALESSPRIPGKRIMGELVQTTVVLLPLAVDPLGKWGPMMDRLLFGTDAREEFTIPSSHPNAATMLRRARSPEFHMGVLTAATLNC